MRSAGEENLINHQEKNGRLGKWEKIERERDEKVGNKGKKRNRKYGTKEDN